LKPLILAAAALLASIPVGAQAQPLPPPEKIATAAERPLLPRFLSILEREEDPAAALKELDALLGQLKEPTQFRGIVQFFRAELLRQQKRERDGRDALLESIRLLPSSTAPLMLAAHIHAYADEAAPATDYFLRALRVDPDIANQIEQYEVWNLVTRLRERDDRRRLVALSERLLELGWSRGRLDMISSLAMSVLDDRLARGDVAGAAQMIPKILLPGRFMTLLTDNRYAPLRSDVEAWGGPKLEKLWPIYLEQARAEWQASRDPEAGRTYAGALGAAAHDRKLVSTFLPLFRGKMDPIEDQDLIFLSSDVASALARLGRWDEVDEVFAKALAVWPAGSQANALNLTGNRGRFLIYKGEFERGLALLDQSIRDAGKLGGEVNTGGLAAIHVYRACALQQLGRAQEDIVSKAMVISRKAVNPLAYAYLQLCAADVEGARKTLIQAFADEGTREEALSWMQPLPNVSYDSGFSRVMRERGDALRQDEAVLTEARKHGRILEWPVNAAAPKE